MIFYEFSNFMDECKVKYPFWFILPMDPPADNVDILNAEKLLDVKFPEQYIQFLRTYGGGDFASIVIYSVSINSKYNITSNNEIYYKTNKSFLAVSDDMTGGYYGWLVNEGVCDSHISYLDYDNRDLHANIYEDLYTYIVEDTLCR